MEQVIKAEHWQSEYPVMIDQGFILEEREDELVWVREIREYE